MANTRQRAGKRKVENAKTEKQIGKTREELIMLSDICKE